MRNTLNVYSHIEDEDIVQSFQSLQERGRIRFGTYDPSQTVAPDDDEGEVDLDERADDDDEE